MKNFKNNPTLYIAKVLNGQVGQIEIDLSERLTIEQAEYQFSVAKNEDKFDLLAIGEDKEGGYLVFKVFPHSLIKRLGFTIIKQNDIKK